MSHVVEKKPYKGHSRIKKVVATAALATALMLGGCTKPTHQVKAKPPQVEIQKKEDSKLWKLFYVKSSWKDGDTFYSVKHTSENAVLIVSKGGDLKMYELGRRDGKSAVITGDEKKLYIVYDGGRKLDVFDREEERLSSADLGTSVSNPALAVRKGRLFIASEGLDHIIIIDTTTSVSTKLSLQPVFDKESIRSLTLPTLEAVSYGIMVTGKGCKGIYTYEDMGDGSMQVRFENMDNVISQSGEFSEPRIIVNGPELCIRPGPASTVSCVVSNGSIKRVIIFEE